jgi:hypothetical protein
MTMLWSRESLLHLPPPNKAMFLSPAAEKEKENLREVTKKIVK